LNRTVRGQEQEFNIVNKKENAMSENQHTLQHKRAAGDPRWRDLYRWGGFSALVAIAAIVAAGAAYAVWPYLPGALSTAEIYAQVLSDRVGALMALDLIYYVCSILSIPLCLGLYVALRRTNESHALIALVIGLMALVLLFTARPIAEVMTLANRYAAAATEAERTRLLAAGEPLLVLFTGSSNWLSYILGTLSLLIFAFLMRDGKVFSKRAAWVGVATNVVAFGLFLPAIGIWLSFASLAGMIIWNIQIARTLFRLARTASAAQAAAG
jgi:hypothetical protein